MNLLHDILVKKKKTLPERTRAGEIPRQQFSMSTVIV